MAQLQQSALCAALLLLHVLLLAAASGMQDQINPRGWQAARQAEQQAAAAVAAAAAGSSGRAPLPTPPLRDTQASVRYPSQQKACDLPPFPAVCPAAQQVSWLQLAAVVAAAFLLGLLCGMLLLAWHHRRKNKRGAPPKVARGMHPADTPDEHVAFMGSAAAAAAVSEIPAACSSAGEPAVPVAVPGQPIQPALSAVGEAVPGNQAAFEPASSTLAEVLQDEQRILLAEVVPAGPASPAAAAISAAAPSSAAAAASQPPGAEPFAATAAAAKAVQDLLLGQPQQAQHPQQEGAAGGGQAASVAVVSSVAAVEASGGISGKAGQQVLLAETSPFRGAALTTAVATSSTGGGAITAPMGLLREEEAADIQAAAALVLTMCGSLSVDPADLSKGERLQLIYTMLQAWQAQQARRHAEEMSRIGSEANLHRKKQGDIAAAQAARQHARDAYKLSLQRTAAFRAMCSDTLTFGLVVMAAAGTYQLLSRGLLASITAACPSLWAHFGGGSSSRWRLWAAWKAGETLACYAFSIGDALLGLAVLLAAPWVTYRSGLLSDYHSMPMTKLFAGLGLICGLAGYLAVGKLGGSRLTWLATWEAWVVLHISFSAAAHRMQRVSLRAKQGGAAGGLAAAGAGAAAEDYGSGGEMYEDSSGWLPGVMWVLLGLVLPIAAGTLPFKG